jgi:putative transcriptional regulator
MDRPSPAKLDLVETLGPPYFLIATPTLLDPNFVHSVILMAQHGTEGALGWVLNRVHEKTAHDLLTPELRERVHPDTPLHIGGPVPTEGLLAVFREPLDGVTSVQLAPGVHVSSSPDSLAPLFTRPIAADGLSRGRLFFGYSGWGPGQLEREMEEGVWLVLPYEDGMAFSGSAEGLWQRCFERLGINPALLTAPSGRKH